MPPKGKPLDPPPGQRQGRVPRLTKEQREERNDKIIRYFIAGVSEREIGKLVNLTGQAVHVIIKNHLKDGARHKQLLTDEALAIYTERLDFLLRAAWGGVRNGDLKSIETARRILEQQARLYSIEDERQGILPPQDLLNQLPDGVDIDPRDELAKFRARHRKAAGDSYVHDVGEP